MAGMAIKKLWVRSTLCMNGQIGYYGRIVSRASNSKNVAFVCRSGNAWDLSRPAPVTNNVWACFPRAPCVSGRLRVFPSYASLFLHRCYHCRTNRRGSRGLLQAIPVGAGGSPICTDERLSPCITLLFTAGRGDILYGRGAMVETFISCL